MSTHASRPASGRLVELLVGGLAAPFRLGTYLRLAYAALLFPLGLGYFVTFTVLLSVGGGLVVIGVGVLILLVTVPLARVVAFVERKQVSLLVGLAVAQPTLERGPDEDLLDQVKALYLDWGVLTEFVYLLTKLAWGVGAFTGFVTAGATTASFLVVPLYYDAPGARVGVLPDASFDVGGVLTVPYGDVAVSARTVLSLTGWTVDTLPEAVLFAGLGVLFAVAAVNALALYARAAGWYAKVLLDAGGPKAAVDELREEIGW